MKATRKCSFCGKSFVTRSGMQRYCSEACKAEARRARMTQKNNLFKAVRPIMEIQHQEYLTFSKAAILMGCSRQYIYKLVAMGKLKASRISNRMAFIRRADIERMLEGNPYHRILPGSTSTPKKSASSSFPGKKEKREKGGDEILDFYSGEEVMSLYKVKQSWLYTTAKRNRIPICRIAGKNYYSKKHVDEFFGTAVDMESITDWLLKACRTPGICLPAQDTDQKRIRPHLLLQVPSGRTQQDRPCERRTLLHRGTGPADLRAFLRQHLSYRQGEAHRKDKGRREEPASALRRGACHG